MGQKTRELLEMVPGTQVTTVERCSGHDGTWGVKTEYFEHSMKIGRPVFRLMAEARPRLRQLRLSPSPRVTSGRGWANRARAEAAPDHAAAHRVWLYLRAEDETRVFDNVELAVVPSPSPKS